MTKSVLRQEMLAKRRSMSTSDVEVLSSQITTRLMALIDWVTVRNVHIYESSSAWNEVSTASMRQRIITRAPYAAVTFGEPSLTAAIPSGKYDLIIVPIVAFDTRCQRIGFGGGWYDRFLSEQPGAQKVGLAFETQRVNSIPVEPHDILLDAVITEANVY